MLTEMIYRCIISSFYIKPQLGLRYEKIECGCIISSFYIKPQQRKFHICKKPVVLYLHSTSNHNYWHANPKFYELYYIFILHQTTTGLEAGCYVHELYYIFILHQTTTAVVLVWQQVRCIISSFYIKPQLA